MITAIEAAEDVISEDNLINIYTVSSELKMCGRYGRTGIEIESSDIAMIPDNTILN